MTRAKLAKRLLSLVLAVTVVGAGITVYSNQNVKDEVYAASAAPEIEKTEYEGKGKVDVEFYGKVQFYKAKVSVKKLSTGKVYSADILRRIPTTSSSRALATPPDASTNTQFPASKSQEPTHIHQ